MVSLRLNVVLAQSQKLLILALVKDPERAV